MVRRAGAVRVVELTADRLAAAAALMAVEHAESGAAVMTGFADETACHVGLSDLLADGFAGWAALIDDALVGVVCVRIVPPVVFVPAHGLAIRVGDEDPTSIVVALLAEATRDAIDDGARRVTLDHVAAPPIAWALHEAGFGGSSVFAVRSTTPLSVRDPGVRIRIGTTDDLESIAELSHFEWRYRNQPPIFALMPDRSIAQMREAHAEMLAAGAVHLIASSEGSDVGLLTHESASPSPRLCPAGAHIGPTSTTPTARGRGVGRALVAAALDDARERGHEHLSVDFSSTNPVSRPFWIGIGFAPTGNRVRRFIASPGSS